MLCVYDDGGADLPSFTARAAFMADVGQRYQQWADGLDASALVNGYISSRGAAGQPAVFITSCPDDACVLHGIAGFCIGFEAVLNAPFARCCRRVHAYQLHVFISAALCCDAMPETANVRFIPTLLFRSHGGVHSRLKSLSAAQGWSFAPVHYDSSQDLGDWKRLWKLNVRFGFEYLEYLYVGSRRPLFSFSFMETAVAPPKRVT